MEIEFESDDDLPLGKMLKVPEIIIVTASVCERNSKYYSIIFLDKYLYELQKCCNMTELIFQKELALIKQVHQSNVCFVFIGLMKMLPINLRFMFVTVFMIY